MSERTSDNCSLEKPARLSDTKSIVRTVPLSEGDVIDIRIAWVRGKRHTIRVTVPAEYDVEIAKSADESCKPCDSEA